MEMIDKRRQCFICGSHYPLERHHVIHGHGRRKQADRFGLVVYLCHKCHTELHDKGTWDKELQRYGQMVFERDHGTREEFRKIFGRSYL